MSPETIDSLAKAGIGGIAIGALLYVIILLIKYISRFAQKHVDAMSAVVISCNTGRDEIKAEIKAISRKIDEQSDFLKHKLIKKLS